MNRIAYFVIVVGLGLSMFAGCGTSSSPPDDERGASTGGATSTSTGSNGDNGGGARNDAGRGETGGASAGATGGSTPGDNGSQSTTGGAISTTGGAASTTANGGESSGGSGATATASTGNASTGSVDSTTGGDGGGNSGSRATGDAGPAADSSAGSGLFAFAPGNGVITGVRGTTTPAATRSVQLHNGGSSAIQVERLDLGGVDRALFQLSGAPVLPTTIAAGGDLSITVELATTGTALPAAPPQDSGATLLTASLTATSSAGAAQISLYGLLLTQALWEPTFGQILTTLGYKLDVGLAQNNANPNRGKTVQQLPGVEPNTDEVAAPLFVKAGGANPELSLVARFSPKGPLPFGWYAPGTPSARHSIAAMARIADAQTSDKARMVLPPPGTGNASFDPGNGPFGIYVYSDQATQMYDTGTATDGDYDYSEDALNSPPGVHRFKAYPLKNASGDRIPNVYLLGVEEASNGDYQDYVFLLQNVSVAQ